jgi:hypothetical protein
MPKFCLKCKTRASFGYKGEKTLYCGKHKLEGMNNLNIKTCKTCDKSPSFGFIGGKTEYCKEHKFEGMEDIVSKRCIYNNCKNTSSYGFVSGLREFCSKHKKHGMINLVHQSCEKCNTQACFGHIGNKAQFCFTHKLDTMVDIVSMVCKSCNLFRVNKSTKYLCKYCNPIQNKKQKTRENRVKQLLEENNYIFIYDKSVRNNDCCFRYRPDFLFDCGTYFLVLECDEDAHSSYDKECEIIRMNNISISLGLPTKFIRYNPDLKGIAPKNKHSKLVETLNKYINLGFLDNPEPIYLFYPERTLNL